MDFVCEKAFLEFIYEKTGICLQEHQLPAFREHVSTGCKKFSYPAPADYLAALQADRFSEEENDFLISAVTVGETCFFRYPEQIDFLRQCWLPRQLERKAESFNKSLYIWSAGCSTGEEIYSLAMLLDQHIPDMKHWTIRLFGTDINKSALKHAAKGIYAEKALKNVPEALKEAYFDRLEDRYKIKASVLRRVNFSYFNLSSPASPSFDGLRFLDLIICNNVFIYLDTAVIRQIMLNFKRLLNADGCLLLAPADVTLAHKLSDGLSLERWKMLSYFQYSSPSESRDSLKVETEKTVTLTLPRNDWRQMKPAKDIEKTIGQFTLEIENAVKKRDHELALELAENALSAHPRQIEFWQHKTQALIHLGRPVEALQASSEAVRHETLNAYPFFFHAMLQLDNNNLKLAQTFFRKALFLNWDFPECHFHFAQLLVRLKDKQKALRHFEAALSIAKGADAEKKMANEPDITYAEFMDILEYEILVLKKSLTL